MNEIAVSVEGISKEYHIVGQRERYSTLRDRLTNLASSPFRSLRLSRNGSGYAHKQNEKNTFWALKGVSFEVQRGEVVGIIGKNGAGKSTLLKILSRITEPTKGGADIRGRVGSLLEVGTGFHPELSGRENIYLNGAILGMRRAEIERKFDEIVQFAEVGKFIDTPVKHYSSGMYLRLAFSVAAHLETEILLIDEVLAVGDAQFQARCLGKMEEVANEGRTVLFVSHNMAAVSNLCSRIIALNNGKIVADGGAEVIGKYLESVTSNVTVDLQHRTDIGPEKKVWVTDVWFAGSGGKPVKLGITGEELAICIRYERRTPGKRPDITLTLYDNFGQAVVSCDTNYSVESDDAHVVSTRGLIKCIVPKLPLMPGEYRLNVLLHRNNEWEDHLPSVARLQVEQGDFYGTGKLPSGKHPRVLVDHVWELTNTNSEATTLLAQSPGYQSDGVSDR